MSNRYGSNNNNFDDDDGSRHFRPHRPSSMNGRHGAFDSSPRQFHGGGGGGGGFPPSGGGFRPMGGGGGGRGFGQNYQMPPTYQQGQVSGQKRGFPFSGVGDSPSYDRFDGGAYAKLFVGSVPRTATEDDIRPLFEEHGHVIEVALIKDRRTGQQQGCCFIKYSTAEEADRAIKALHNQRTIPGGAGPIQVRYADGERERLGAVEYKLFVGSLNKQATEKEVEEIFLPYGRVEDVYLMRDEFKQSRGCGFVKYTHRDMALAAINALNGKYTMRGCDQPITVRFADPKRPRQADSRNGPAFGGPGVGPRFDAPGVGSRFDAPGVGSRFDAPGVRPPLDYGYPRSDRVPPSGLHPVSEQNMGPTSNVVIHGLGNQPLNMSAATEIPPNPGVKPGNSSGPPEYSYLGPSSLTSQQLPPGQQISPLQKSFQPPQHNPSLALHSRNQVGYSQTATSLTSQRQTAQLKSPPSATQAPSNQALPQKPLPGISGCYSAQLPSEHSTSSPAVRQTPVNLKLDLQATSGTINRQQLTAPVQPQNSQPSQQPSSQLALLLSQQTQTLKASFQSSQQAFSQLQQQVQQMQPSTQNLLSQQNPQAIKQQSQWAGSLQQGVASILPASSNIPPSMSGDPAAPILTQTVPSVKCNWTEHTSPDGYKYYYNSATNESKWEKPEEFAVLEQQKSQIQSHQQQQTQFHQIQPTQQVSQTHIQLQTHLRPHQSSYQPTSASLYQTSGYMGHQNIQEIGYTQLQAASRPVADRANLQQGHHAAKEWGWREKPAGYISSFNSCLMKELKL